LPETPTKRHARLGPSSSEIWLNCLGAPAEWAKRPPRQVGFAAHEGTLAHVLCEAALTLNAIPWKEGTAFTVEGSYVPITQDMLNAVSLYATTTGLISDSAVWRAVEKEVSIAWLWGANPPSEELFGTADFSACDGTVLYILDLKYGRGKAVKPEFNTQLLCYAIGVLGLLRKERPDLAASVTEVCLVIVQPRAGGAPVRQWTVPLGDLLYWAYATLKPAIDKILSGKPLPLTAGNYCYFCAASPDCPVYHRLRVQTSIASFPDWTEDDRENHP
jgi:hypothetical protein